MFLFFLSLLLQRLLGVISFILPILSSHDFDPAIILATFGILIFHSSTSSGSFLTTSHIEERCVRAWVIPRDFRILLFRRFCWEEVAAAFIEGTRTVSWSWMLESIREAIVVQVFWRARREEGTERYLDREERRDLQVEAWEFMADLRDQHSERTEWIDEGEEERAEVSQGLKIFVSTECRVSWLKSKAYAPDYDGEW